MDASNRGQHSRAGRVARRKGKLADHPAMRRLLQRVSKMSDEQRERLASYLDERLPVSEQLRLAIDASGQSRYAIFKATGIDQGQLSRYMAGTTGLSMNALDAVCAYLGLELRPVRRGKATKAKA